MTTENIRTIKNYEESLQNVIVVIGAGSIGIAIARWVGTSKHILISNRI